MSLVTSNNVKLIIASPVGVADTSITLVSAAGLPDVSDPADWTIVTLIRPADSLYEIVRVDAIVGAVLTVQRAQEGTAALTFQGGDALRNYFTSGMFDQFTFEADTAVASAAAAAVSETNASNSEAIAVASAAAAAISETNAGLSETNAASSAANALTSANNAATSETNALTSETNAGLSAVNAATSETNAGLSAAEALVSETNASTSELNAAASESNAFISSSNAATSETNAGLSAAAASTSEANAALSELNADTSAGAALASANNAATSETNAATSAAAALVSETNAAASAGGPYNEAIDGQFNHWYTGTSTSTPGYATDIWGFSPGGGTATVSRQTFTLGQVDVPGTPKYYLQYDQTVDGTSVDMLYQRQADCTKFSGSNVTVSVYGKVSSGTLDVQSIFTQNFGTGGSPSSAVTTTGSVWTFTTSWQKFSATIAVPSVSGKTLGTDLGSDYWGLTLRAADAATTFTAQIANVGCSKAADGFSGSWLSAVEERIRVNPYFYSRADIIITFPHNSNTASRAYSASHPTKMIRIPTSSYSAVGGWTGGVPTITSAEEYYRIGGSASAGVGGTATVTGLTMDARYT